MNRSAFTVAVQAASETRRRELAAALAQVRDVDVVLGGASSKAEAVLLAVGEEPLADLSLAAAMQADGRARAVLLCGPAPTPEFLLAAMRAGIGEYLCEPLRAEELRSALERLRGRASQLGQMGQAGQGRVCAGEGQGRVFLVLGSKGGVGTTTVAVNLADVLCRLNVGPTALLDLAQPQGETPIFLDLEHAYTWGDVAANMERLDATYLESVMARHSSGLCVLPAPGFSLDSALDPLALRRMLTLMRGMYAHVVIDAGTGHDDAALEALVQADEILLVLDLSLPCLARAKRFLEVVRATQPDLAPKLRLVANRKTSESDIGSAEAENILQAKIGWSVLNDYKTALAAINQGRTLTETDPRSAIARGIAAMGRELARSAPLEPENAQGGSLWARLRNLPLSRGLARRQA